MTSATTGPPAQSTNRSRLDTATAPAPPLETATAPDTATTPDLVSDVACCPPLTRQPLSAAQAETAAAMFKALGDPVRLRIFSMIASAQRGELCVCDVPDVGVSQPTVSHHLKKLREAGLLTSRKEATWVHYRVAPEVLAGIARLIQPVA
ncbi:MAG: ArsR/SmtB family transcription factor [Dermatophilaceae bacterium]